MKRRAAKDFERLVKISKVLIPTLVIFSVIFYQCYRYSIDTVEINVISKHVAWFESCTEHECVELPAYIVESADESFTTTQPLYDQITENNIYLVGVKGWSSFGSSRKLTHLY